MIWLIIITIKVLYIIDIKVTFKRVCNLLKVKECLQPYEETSFQTIISELRNTVMNSYWNKEVGKTRYQISNLPIGMNPLEVTFGKKLKSGMNYQLFIYI